MTPAPSLSLRVLRIETFRGKEGAVAMEVAMGPDSPISLGGILVCPDGGMYRYDDFVGACNQDGHSGEVEGKSRDLVLLALEDFLTNEAIKVNALRARLHRKAKPSRGGEGR